MPPDSVSHSRGNSASRQSSDLPHLCAILSHVLVQLWREPVQAQEQSTTRSVELDPLLNCLRTHGLWCAEPRHPLLRLQQDSLVKVKIQPLCRLHRWSDPIIQTKKKAFPQRAESNEYDVTHNSSRTESVLCLFGTGRLGLSESERNRAVRHQNLTTRRRTNAQTWGNAGNTVLPVTTADQCLPIYDHHNDPSVASGWSERQIHALWWAVPFYCTQLHLQLSQNRATVPRSSSALCMMVKSERKLLTHTNHTSLQQGSEWNRAWRDWCRMTGADNAGS